MKPIEYKVNGEIVVKSLFDIELKFTSKVVKIEYEDGTKPAWAIQLKDGSYWGQKWVTDNSRTYPVWSTKKRAQNKLDRLLKEELS